MKYGVCSFSGHSIYRGKGRIVVFSNGSSFLLGNRKSRSYFMRKMNPKKLSWTLASRISRKKATAFKVSKVQAPKVVKSIRSFVGLSLDELKNKMGAEEVKQEPSVRFSKRDKIKRVSQSN
ncbi:large subunit ribosomal protein L24e [Nematocida homosporus]|uniref:large subunit ribosomal protein L24e n=1 Tax=Nematocida homosporus TaxID=1912981 RepID=UPI00221FFC38|nr:large subunit ribosomal protein L24e [Nematocida homosporus]KAI5185505.1 large subunit ribosomal protein L24e [Nematocida homosporus]